MKLYFDLTKTQARAAFDEFVAERGPALDRLRALMMASGLNPDEVLDGTVESLEPLWRWVVSRLTRRDDPGATDPATAPRDAWPSWERHTWEVEPVLSLESLTLLDGVVSYLAEVVMARVPGARWDIAHHRIKRYVVNNHPILTSGPGEVHAFLPGYLGVQARRTLNGVERSTDDALTAKARRLIEELTQGQQPVPEPSVEVEPAFEIEDIRTEPGGYDFEISLGEQLAHDRSDEVERMVEDLAREDGVTRAIREDREAILLSAPHWSAEKVRAWWAARL